MAQPALLTTWGIVTVSNTGRRPIYISHASLALPKGYKATHLLLWEGLGGQKLGEGAQPVDYIVNQDGMEEYKKDWKKIRAMVIDASGKNYYSKVDKSNRPSWAR